MNAPTRHLAANWDIALASSALLLIVGGMAAPHVKRLVGKQREAQLRAARRPPQRAPEPLVPA